MVFGPVALAYNLPGVDKLALNADVIAKVFTGNDGKFVELADTIQSFKEIVDGKHDSLPEEAFYMVGGISEVVEKARKLAGG